MVEVVVVLALIFTMAVILLPAFSKAKIKGGPNCVSNLKQIGLSYLIWAGDNNDRYPTEVSVANGGIMELAGGRNAWLTFFVMSNELSTPKVLVCPQDLIRLPPATHFSSQLAGHISYFVGLDAKPSDPQALLSGDDNFAVGGVPVKSGLLILVSNTPVIWTAARHHFAGNVALADGSVQQMSSSGLTNWFRQTGLATNRLAIP